jgi:ribose transport system substrate-binding protein
MKHRKRIIRIAVLLAVAGIVLPAVFLYRRHNTQIAERSIAVVMKTTSENMEFWRVVRSGMDMAAKEFEVTPDISGPLYEKQVEEQMRILEEIISRRPAAILLVAADFDAPVPLVERAIKKGIIVVTLDSGVNTEKVSSFVGTDNVAAGRTAGKEMARLIKTGKDLVIISHLIGVATSIDREWGVRSAFREYADNNILDTLFSQNDLDVAYQTVAWLLKERPDAGGIVALNETSTLGAAMAVRDAGMNGKIIIVGFDSSIEEIELLESGVIQALVVQRPLNMGYLGIRTVVELLGGRRVPGYIDTGSVLVRKDNMFSQENQKLLFPFTKR